MARRNKIVKGETTEERFRLVDVELHRLKKRSQKVVSILVPPFPISEYVKTSGVIFRYLFACNGSVKHIAVFIEKMPKGGVELSVSLAHGNTVTTESVLVKKQNLVLDLRYSIKAGDRVIVECLNNEASGFWIGMSMIPSVKECDVHKEMIDKLELLEKEEEE
jgi:hypothetical protein